MYVEFLLAKETAPAYKTSLAMINRDLHAWSDRYNIPYKIKFHKFTKRVMFDQYEHYSFFALTFEPTSYSSRRWSLVEPMQRPKSIDKQK